MSTKHTPGPWHVATNPGGPMDQPAFPSVRDSSGLIDGWDIVCMPLGDSDTVKANARLIAASPDLLKVCQELFEEFDNRYDGAEDSHSIWMGEHLEALRLVIAKATEGRE